MPRPQHGASRPVDAATVRAALGDVVDPCCREREISVIDMGLLESVTVDDDHVTVEVLLTSGWCPFQVDLVDTITATVETMPGVASADVRITLDGAWSTARMSDEARRKLQFLPEPGTVDRDRFVADRLPSPPPLRAPHAAGGATVPGPRHGAHAANQHPGGAS